MLFTRTPNSGQHISPIAPQIVPISQPQPPHLRLPQTYVPNPPPDAFLVNELVIIAEEFEIFESAGRINETPGYRIIETPGGLASPRLYYKLQNIRTLRERDGRFERQELRPLFARRGTGGRDGEGNGGSGGNNQAVVKDWDAQTLIGDGGGGGDGNGAASRDDETLRGDEDGNDLSDGVRRS